MEQVCWLLYLVATVIVATSANGLARGWGESIAWTGKCCFP